jgi:hypothetical protein
MAAVALHVIARVGCVHVNGGCVAAVLRQR